MVATGTAQPVLCPMESFSLGGTTFNAQNPSGEVLLANMAANGCDSLVQVSLSFLLPSETFLTATSCNPNSVGVDTLVLTNAVGCDSLVITTTTFDASAVSITNLTAHNCDPSMVGMDTLILTSSAGCDSLVITTTVLAPMSQTNLTASSCNPSFVGVDTLVLSNFYGCDSLVITTTSFDASAISITNLTALNCDPSMVGMDTLLLTSLAGCDSLVITTTTLAPMSQTNLTATSCNPSLVGVDTLVLSNFYGCDSLVITTTSFDASAISVTNLTALNCDPSLVGVDTLVLTSLAGCDSLVITTTTLAPTSQTNLNATSCNPSLVGVDTLVLSNFYGCDSLVITATSFDASLIPVTQLTAQSCDPGLVGVDTLVLASFGGCDSLVITTTSLVTFSQTFLTATSCDWADVGTDTLTLTNQYGCDSLVITTTSFVGLDFESSSQAEFCFGENNGLVQLDTALTDQLPVSFALENQPSQTYTGSPLTWAELTPGTYTLTATNSAGCTVSQQVVVEAAAVLQLDVAEPFAMHLGDSVWVKPSSNFQVEAAQWSPTDGVRCPTCEATYIAAPHTMDYTLLATDENGCSATITLTVEVDESVRVYVPTAIRPGSDNSPNTDFIIFAGPEVASIRSLQLFDRWGGILFEQKDLVPNQPTRWDGTAHGKAVQTGVLVWMATVETIDGRVVNLSGDIAVLR
jgi:hypothetical protein